jgi:hypothetical protein
LRLNRNQREVCGFLNPVIRTLLATVLVLALLLPVRMGVAAATDDIFSGTVKQFTDRTIIVVHKVAGHQPVTREFTVDRKTTVEGMLRITARVTVRYRTLGNGGFVAVQIIVRLNGRAA